MKPWPRTRTQEPRTKDPRTQPQSLKVGPGTPLKRNSGTLGPYFNLKKWDRTLLKGLFHECSRWLINIVLITLYCGTQPFDEELQHIICIHFCSMNCSYANMREFHKSMTKTKEKRKENMTCKRWRKRKVWQCRNYLFSSYKLKLHIIVHVKLRKNPVL